MIESLSPVRHIDSSSVGLLLLCCVSAFISNLTIQRQHFPNDDDEIGAAKALTRLLDTYQLDTNTMSTGQLPGECRPGRWRSYVCKTNCFLM